MRAVQRAMATFAARSVIAPWLGRMLPEPLVSRVAATSATAALEAWGCADGGRGLVYVLQDLNRTQGAVGDAQLRVSGLPADTAMRVEVWSTSGASESPLAAVSTATVGDVLVLPLPAFEEDVVVAFVAG